MKREHDNAGKVVLLKPYPNGAGRMLPKGQVVVFDKKQAEELIKNNIADKWFPGYEQAMIVRKNREKPIAKKVEKPKRGKIEDKGVEPEIITNKEE
jgi:hypothetical protein